MNRRFAEVLAMISIVAGAGGCDRIKGMTGGAAEAGAPAEAGAKSSPATTQATTGAPAATAPPKAAAGPKDDARAEENLLSIAAGAMIVEEPTKGTTNYPPWDLLDDNPDSFWQNNELGTHTILIALPQRTKLSRLEWQGAASKVGVEVSDSVSGKDGFQKIGEATLTDSKANHSFGDGKLQPIPIKEVPARWVRFTVENTVEYPRNNEVHGYGTKLDDPPWTADITGTYGPMESGLGDLRIRKDANGVSGCVANYQFTGAIEGHLVKLSWRSVNSDTERGPALINVSPDGTKLVFMRYREGSPTLFTSTGSKKSAKVGATDCPHWKEEGKADPLLVELEKQGRVRLHGIRFDTDSDVIRPEGKPLLDRVAAMLKTKADWKVTIEGHTDSTAATQHNQTLSEKRAKAVQKYVADKGIDAKRLNAVGFGETKPIAPNETSTGRAENRRVELVKQ